jgi:DNA-binding transcriptional MerR regulator
MYSTGDLKERFGVSGTTVRNWARTYAEFLSPSASPPKGEVREYSEQDALVLATIARESHRRTPSETVRTMLEAGELVDELPQPLPTVLGEPVASDSRVLVHIQELRLELAEARQELAVYGRLEEQWQEERATSRKREEELLLRIGRLERELELYKSGEL